MIPIKDSIPSRQWPIVNFLIIAANAFVFYKEIQWARAGALEASMQMWALVPQKFLSDPRGQWFPMFSAMFLHGGFLHFFGNMLYLYIFGDNVEDAMGHLRYLIFYLLCGILAFLFQTWMFPQSLVPMIGASGAIAGVLGAYFILYPHAHVLTVVPIWIFIRIISLPAYLLLGLWFLIQALNSRMSLAAGASAGGVAWWAHAGGFLAGVILIFFFRERRR